MVDLKIGVRYIKFIPNSFQFPYIAEEDLYTDVKWLQEEIVYQIFPDRF